MTKEEAIKHLSGRCKEKLKGNIKHWPSLEMESFRKLCQTALDIVNYCSTAVMNNNNNDKIKNKKKSFIFQKIYLEFKACISLVSSVTLNA